MQSNDKVASKNKKKNKIKNEKKKTSSNKLALSNHFNIKNTLF